MKIKTKISLSLSLVAMVLVTAACFVVYRSAKNSVIDEVEDRLKGIALEKDRHIETYLNMMSSLTVQLAKSVTLEKYLKAEKADPKTCQELYDLSYEQLRRRKSGSRDVQEFILINSSGKIVVSTDLKLLGLDRSDDSIFLGAKDGVYIKDAYTPAGTSDEVMGFSAPIKDGVTGEFLGVMAARVKMEALNRIMINRIGLDRTGETYLLNKYGYMITPSRFVEDTFLKMRVNTKNFKHAVDDMSMEDESLEDKRLSEERAIIAPDYRGIRVLGCHAYIGKMRWYLLAEIDESEALKPIMKLRKLFIIIVVLLVVLSWIIGGKIAEFITRPIENLKNGIEKVGKGDLDHRVGTAIHDEVGELSRSFDEMTSNLKKVTASVDILNELVAGQKLAENKLKEAAENWQTTFDSILDPIAIQDKDFRLVRVNKAYSELTNTSTEKIIGRHCFEVVHGLDSPPDRCPHVQAIRSGKSVTEEVYEPSLERWYTVSVSPIFDEKGNLSQVVHFMRDITERKRSEDKLNEQLAQLEKMNKFMVDRELAMSDMKAKLKSMERRLGGGA